MPVLILQSSGRQPRHVSLEQSPLRIGRSQNNDICLADDAAVSRNHAELRGEGDRWEVVDLGSHNGTFVGDERIDGPVALQPGMRIRVGRATMVFAESAEAAMAWNMEPTARPYEATSMVVPVSEIMSTTYATSLHAVGADRSTAQGRAFAALGRAAEVLLSQRPLDEVLQIVLDMIFQTVSPERGAVVLLEGEPARLAVRASRGMDIGEQLISRTIAQLVIQQQQSVLIKDARDDPRFFEAQSLDSHGVHAALAVPLWNNREVIGLVYADTTTRPIAFDKTDLEVLTLIANFAAVKIDNVRLFERDLKMRELERDMQAAGRIQQRLLPASPPAIDGWEIFGFNSPCREVGGDYYDFAMRPNGRLGLALGDVAGKGMPAALLMATCQAAFRVHVATDASPIELVARLNDTIHANSDVDKFVTFFYAELDIATGRLEYVNAGHNPPMLFRAGGGFEELAACGTVLGFRPGRDYRLATTTLGPGDLLLTFSDGLTESQDPDSEEFGEERLAETVRGCRDGNVQAIWQRIEEAVRDFVGEAPPFDDLTVTLVKRLR